MDTREEAAPRSTWTDDLRGLDTGGKSALIGVAVRRGWVAVSALSAVETIGLNDVGRSYDDFVVDRVSGGRQAVPEARPAQEP